MDDNLNWFGKVVKVAGIVLYAIILTIILYLWVRF